jgi:hypothetical protein
MAKKKKTATTPKMELRGSVVPKIPPEKKEKMQRTLDRMNKVREEDHMRLREAIKTEMAELEAAYAKDQAMLKALEDQSAKIKIQINDTKIAMVKKQEAYKSLENVCKKAEIKLEEPPKEEK